MQNFYLFYISLIFKFINFININSINIVNKTLIKNDKIFMVLKTQKQAPS